ADEVDARRDHGGRVDEGGDGRGAGHGVREPDVERDLRALSGTAEETHEPDCSRRRDRDRLRRLEEREDAAVLTAPDRPNVNLVEVTRVVREDIRRAAKPLPIERAAVVHA